MLADSFKEASATGKKSLEYIDSLSSLNLSPEAIDVARRCIAESQSALEREVILENLVSGGSGVAINATFAQIVMLRNLVDDAIESSNTNIGDAESQLVQVRQSLATKNVSSSINYDVGFNSLGRANNEVKDDGERTSREQRNRQRKLNANRRIEELDRTRAKKNQEIT